MKKKNYRFYTSSVFIFCVLFEAQNLSAQNSKPIFFKILEERIIFLDTSGNFIDAYNWGSPILDSSVVEMNEKRIRIYSCSKAKLPKSQFAPPTIDTAVFLVTHVHANYEDFYGNFWQVLTCSPTLSGKDKIKVRFVKYLKPRKTEKNKELTYSLYVEYIGDNDREINQYNLVRWDLPTY